MAFQPGVSGNPGGRPKRKLWTEAILEAVEKVDENSVDKRTRLQSLADALVLAGLAGEVPAMQEVGNRIEGRVPQAVVGADGGPIEVTWLPLPKPSE